MAKQATKSRNDDRRCGKARKQNPGPNPKQCTGKTVGGYSPAKIAARHTRRLTPAAVGLD